MHHASHELATRHGAEDVDESASAQEDVLANDVHYIPDTEPIMLDNPRSKHAAIRRNRWLNIKAELERVGSLGTRDSQEAHDVARDAPQDASMLSKYPRVPTNFFEFSDEEEDYTEDREKELPEVIEVEVERIPLFSQLVQEIVEERRIEDARVGRTAGRRVRRPQAKDSRSPPRQDPPICRGSDATPLQNAQGVEARPRKIHARNEDRKAAVAMPVRKANRESRTSQGRSLSTDESVLPRSTRLTVSALAEHDRKGGSVQQEYLAELDLANDGEYVDEENREQPRPEMLREKRRLEKERLRSNLLKEKARLQGQLAAQNVVHAENTEDDTNARLLTKREEKARLLEQKRRLEKEARELRLRQEQGQLVESSSEIVTDTAQTTDMDRKEKLRLRVTQWFGTSRMAGIARRKRGALGKEADEDDDDRDVDGRFELQRSGDGRESRKNIFNSYQKNDDIVSQQSSGRASLVAAPVVERRRIDSERRSRSEDLPVQDTGYRMMASRLSLSRQRALGIGQANRMKSPSSRGKAKQSATKKEVLDDAAQSSIRMRQLTKHLQDNTPSRSGSTKSRGEVDTLLRLIQREAMCETFRSDAVNAINDAQHVLDEMLQLAARPHNQGRHLVPAFAKIRPASSPVAKRKKAKNKNGSSPGLSSKRNEVIEQNDVTADGIDNLLRLIQCENSCETFRSDAVMAINDSHYVLDEMLQLAGSPRNQGKNLVPAFSKMAADGVDNLLRLIQCENSCETFRSDAVITINNSHCVLDEMLQLTASPRNQGKNLVPAFSKMAADGIDNLLRLIQCENSCETYRSDAVMAINNSDNVLDEMHQLAGSPRNQGKKLVPAFSKMSADGVDNLLRLIQCENSCETFRSDAVMAINNSDNVLDEMLQLAAIPRNRGRKLVPAFSKILSTPSPESHFKKTDIEEQTLVDKAERKSIETTDRNEGRNDIDDVWQAEVLSRIHAAKEEAKGEVDKHVSRTLAELDMIKQAALANVQKSTEMREASLATGSIVDMSVYQDDDKRLLESLQKFESEIVSVVQTSVAADDRASAAENMIKKVKKAEHEAHLRTMANKLRPEVDSGNLVQSANVEEALELVLGEIASVGNKAKAEVGTYLKKAMRSLRDAEKEAIKTVHSSRPSHKVSPLVGKSGHHTNSISKAELEECVKRLDSKIVSAHRRAHSAELKTKAAEKHAKEADVKRRRAELRERANAVSREHDFQTRLYIMRRTKGEASVDANISNALGKIEKAKSSVDELVQNVLNKLESVELAAASSLKKD